MKKELHPTNYRLVVFQDLNNGSTFLTKSTVETEETIKFEGSEYPLVKVHVSSASHPFFTGQEKMIDIEGRVDKFNARMAAAKSKRSSAKKSDDKEPEAKKTITKLADLKVEDTK
jgi:large subunit ribosomal protein L31